MPGNAMSIYVKSFEVNAVDAHHFNKAYERNEVISLREEGKEKVYVTGHNVLDVFTKKTLYWRADEFRGVIAEWKNQGYEVELITCVPSGLPEDLKEYVVEKESNKEWGVNIEEVKWMGENSKVRVYESSEEVSEKWWANKREEKKENMRKIEEEYGEVVKEWWLDIEECKIKEEWYKERCFRTLTYMRKYEWSDFAGWKKNGQVIMQEREYGTELWVICNAPELGFLEAEDI